MRHSPPWTPPSGLSILQPDPGSSLTKFFLGIPPSYTNSLNRIQGPPRSSPCLVPQFHFSPVHISRLLQIGQHEILCPISTSCVSFSLSYVLPPDKPYCWRRQWQPTPVFLPGESQGQGAWWAAVYGVAQSRTRLKRLSSSSSKPIVSKAWSILGFSWVRAVPIPWGSTWRSQQGLAGSCPFWCCHMQTAHLAPSDLTFCGELAKQRLSLGHCAWPSCSQRRWRRET